MTRERIENLDLSIGPRFNGKSVFLSASFPSASRSPDFFDSADPDEITQAVVALTRAVFASEARLVFGGHPTISPLIMDVSQDYLWQRSSRQPRPDPLAVVYQSEVFRDFTSPATMRMMDENLSETIFTPTVAGESLPVAGTPDPQLFPRSLADMRSQMLGRQDLAAGVFIGGMEGIREEAQTLRELNPNVPQFYVGAPGGAAQLLAQETLQRPNLTSDERDWLEYLMVSREYVTLMQRILLRIV
jgi:hypothetical protein